MYNMGLHGCIMWSIWCVGVCARVRIQYIRNRLCKLFQLICSILCLHIYSLLAASIFIFIYGRQQRQSQNRKTSSVGDYDNISGSSKMLRNSRNMRILWRERQSHIHYYYYIAINPYYTNIVKKNMLSLSLSK